MTRGTTALLLMGWMALAFGVLRETPRSSDLLALWLAGQAFASGETFSIYPEIAPLFTLHPPADWPARALAIGHDGVVFPYIYPPLWAALVAPLTGALSFGTFAGLMQGVNAALMAATGFLAWRIMGKTLPWLTHLAASQVLMYGTLFGTLALNENQPQILVTFLIALSIERLRADAPAAAGTALALAASIKVYPALFILLIMAAGHWRAVLSFGLAGAALALASIALAGWPLHAWFLATLATISRTCIEIGPSFSLDRLLAPLLANGPAQVISESLGSGSPGRAGWQVSEKSRIWVTTSNAILLALVLGLAVWMRRASEPRRYAAVWPAAVILLAIPAPITWAYYFCLPVMMAPALIPLMGRRMTVALTLAVFAPFTIAFLQVAPAWGLPVGIITQWGLPAMVLLALAFIRWGRSPDRPLHRAGHRL